MPARLARLSILGLVASAVAPLAACSSDAGAPPAPAWLYQSGTRLRARVTDTGGGARRFDGWTDTQLATPCTFRRAADGVRRCVPMADIIYGPAFYLDAACSVPATDYVDPKAAAPFFATNGPLVVAPPAACGADLVAAGRYDEYAVESWRVGPEQTTSGAYFYRDDSGGCIQFPMSVSPVYPLEPVAPAQLVGATTTIEPRGPSMAVEILTGDDGSKAIGQMFDTARGRPCFASWVYFVTNDYRCYAATARPRTEPPPGCGSGAIAACADEIFVDGSVCGPSFHTLAAAPCGPSGADGFDFYELGAPFDPARFASLTSELVGTGRVRLVITRPLDDDRPLFVNPPFFASQDRYTPGSFFDTERQLPCEAATFEDGTIRCLTLDTLSADTYSDPACTNPIAPERASPSCATAAPPTPAQLAFGSPGRLYTLGSLVARTEAYFLDPSAVPPTCVRTSPAARYYDLVPADPTILAPLTALTE